MENRPIPVWIGGDSSPASGHGSPLKRTQPQIESVSTDLHVLSRGFIPGEINGNVGMENRPMPVCIGGDSSPASDHGSPLKRTQTESVSTDLHALSRGFIPGEISRNVGYGDICRAGFQSRHLCCRVWKPDPCRFGLAGTQVPPQAMEVRSSGLSLRPSRFQPTCMP